MDLTDSFFANLPSAPSERSIGEDIELSESEQNDNRVLFRAHLQARVDSGEAREDPSRYSMACLGLDYGLSDEVVFQELMWYNRYCKPHVTPDVLKLRIVNAKKYKQNNNGCKATQTDKFQIHYPSKEVGKDDHSRFTPQPIFDEITYEIFAESDVFRMVHPGCGLTHKQVRSSEGVTKNSNELKSSANNIILLIISNEERPGRLWKYFYWNVWNDKIYIKQGAPWRASVNDQSETMTEADWSQLVCHFAKLTLDAHKDQLRTVITNFASRRPYHPIKARLEALKWDGISRLGQVFNFGDQYTANVLEAHIYASIYRLYYPGEKWDHIMVLISDEGHRKSSFVELMGLGYSYPMDRIPHDDRERQRFLNAWWVELVENSAVSQTSWDYVKGYITQQKDVMIKQYASEETSKLRQNIFVWTLNFSSDKPFRSEENRRFHPIPIFESRSREWMEEFCPQLHAEVFQKRFLPGIVKPHDLIASFETRAAHETSKLSTKTEGFDWVMDWERSNPSREFNLSTALTTIGLPVQYNNLPLRAKQDKMARLLKGAGYEYNQQTQRFFKKGLNLTWNPDTIEI